ncbi:hypothetical protein Tco_0394694 [Tanacetum coccineum]
MSLSLAENVIVAGADNRPPMLDKTQYSSWTSHMLLYIKGKENGKLLVDPVRNGPFKYGTVTVPGTPTTPTTVRDRTYDELTNAEKLHKSFDIKATNIVLQGLPQNIYHMLNHHTEAKDIWDRVKLLIEGSKILLQERASKLYNEFDMFTSVPGETIHTNYLRYLRQHEAHANEVRLTRQRYPNPIALVANTYDSSPSYTNQSQYHQQLSPVAQQYYSSPVTDLAIPFLLPSDDPIDSLNKAMDFISTSFTSRYPPTNNQLRNLSNPRNQANHPRCTATGSSINKNGGTSIAGPVKFKEKVMLAEALKSGVELDEEHTTFLADNGDTVTTGQASQELVTTAAFQTDDLDAFDSNCDEAPSASVVLMAKLSAYDLEILSEVKAIEESKDLTLLSLDELIGNLKVYEMIIKKDSKRVKAKGERKSIALNAKKESSDEECSTSESKDEEYAMAVRDFKKFFKRRGRFLRQPRSDKKTFQSNQDDKNNKCERKFFRCGDLNHLIGECPKPPKDKNQRAFVRGSWNDSGEEDDKKAKDETCLVAQASNKVCSYSSYFSDKNSSIGNFTLDNEYDKLCKMSLKIITKNKQLKAIRNSLESELSELKLKLSTLEKNKRVDLECTNCQSLKIHNEKLKDGALKLTQFEKSTHCLNEMLSNQKPFGDKLGLGFNSFKASISETRKIKFMKSYNETPSGSGPSNAEGGPHKAQTSPK